MGQPVLSVRIDGQVESETWRTRYPDGREEISRVVVPPHSPVAIPEEALQDEEAMASWAQQTHGSTGRLLLTQRHGDWWIVNDSDLERTLLCGSPAWVARIAGEDSYEAFSWRPDLTIARWIMNNYDL